MPLPPAPEKLTLKELLERNREYSILKHRPLPPFVQMMGNNVKTNAPHIVVVSCLDSRANPYEILGFNPLECIVFRNISGRITPALTDIAAVDTFFHINQIIILHHSNCGATHFPLETQLNDVKSKCPNVTSEDLEHVARLSPARPDDDSALRADLKTLRQCSFIRQDLVESALGLYLDVKTGLVREVQV